MVPKSGNSASMKQSAAVTGMSANSALSISAVRTAAICQSMASTSFVLSRPDTNSWVRTGLRKPPDRRVLVALGIDDVHTGRTDHDVIDVGSALRDLPVVQRDDAVTECRQLLAELAFSGRAGLPRPRGLRVVGQGEDQSTEPGMGLANAVLALAVPTIELLLSRSAGYAQLGRR
jgi:hypothetical protein